MGARSNPVCLAGEVLEVQPSPGRVLLMDQDITHAVTSPQPEAGDRPRYSLVLKLVMHPRDEPSAAAASSASASLQLADPSWGDGTLCVGSACAPPESSGGDGSGRTRQPSDEFQKSRQATKAHIDALMRAAAVYYGAKENEDDGQRGVGV